jgi:hypothetical protein
MVLIKGHDHGKVCQLEILAAFIECIHKIYLNILNSWILVKSMIDN